MPTLSLCMIVKNEEKNLDTCLKSCYKLFDEIIIVDTGSTDTTKEIAKKYTKYIYDYKWCDDFSKARNFSFSKATKDYIMWLDADDIILSNDLEKLLNLKQSLTLYDYILLKYNLSIDENGMPALSYYRERIFRREKNFVWKSPIHEVISPKGKISYFDIAITHNKKEHILSDRNLKIFEKMKINNLKFDTRQTFYYARELMYHGKYKDAIKEYKKFLNSKKAWKENIISACIDLHYIYIAQNNTKNALRYLFKTFEVGIPRAEVCCHIATIFLNQNNIETAIYWYKQALNNEYNITTGGFYQPDYYYFIPNIQLCVCYYKQNNLHQAKIYNELAGSFKPNHPSYLNNKEILKNIP